MGAAFIDEEKRLKKGFRGWILKYDIKIRHIGSTVIPSIDAKPIIDILVGMRSVEDIHWVQEPLEKLGYTLVPHASEKDKLFFALGSDIKRTHHVNVVQYQSDYWKNDLLFRDYLLANPNTAAKYGQIKTKLAKKFANDRKTYTEGKKKFIESVLSKAKLQRAV